MDIVDRLKKFESNWHGNDDAIMVGDAIDRITVQNKEIEYLRNQLAECQKDAERYRWLKPNYAMANFDLYDAQQLEPKKCGIIFEMPDGLSYGADLDVLIDQAMSEKG